VVETIGIIGAGRIAQAITRLLLKSGYQVAMSNSRHPSSLKNIIEDLGKGVKGVTREEAAKNELVILALPWNGLHTVTTLTDWNGKIVIDATNHFVTPAPPLELADLGGKCSSELVAEFVPGARLVKAFNTLYFELLGLNLMYPHGNRVLFISGDDGDAKRIVSEIIASIRFVSIDLGSLRIGGIMHQAGGLLAGKNLILLH
jgi:predicted dinucleotide-binding enzyme